MTPEHLGECIKWFNRFYDGEFPYRISNISVGHKQSYVYATGEEKEPERYLTVLRENEGEFLVNSSRGKFSIKF